MLTMFASVAGTLWSLSGIQYRKQWGQIQVFLWDDHTPSNNARCLLKNNQYKMNVSEECKDNFKKNKLVRAKCLSSACQVSKNQKCITVRLVSYSITYIEKKYQHKWIQTKHTVGT